MPDLSPDTPGSPALAGGVIAPETPSTGRGAPSRAKVSAVVVARDAARWLAECLDSIAAQRVTPERLVVVDVGSTDTTLAIATAHQGVRTAIPEVSILETEAGLTLGQAVARAVASLPPLGPGTDEWVWLLHEGAAARASTLERLVEAVLRSPSVGVAGPKVVSWDDPRRLVELGVQVTRTGRRIASPARGEADQGQHDGRSDVLAVATSGMLVRRAVWSDLGGFDAAFDGYGADLDFGWRAQLAGHRVIVVPGAVLRDATTLTTAGRPGPSGHGVEPRPAEVERRTRRAARQVALARSSPLAAPFVAIWMAVSAVVSSATLLVAKRPRQAWRELADVSALVHPLATAGARWRGRATKRLRRDHLSTLFVSPAAAARTTADHIQDAITPERTRRREVATSTETGPVADSSESLDVLPASLPRRIATHPGFLVVAAVLAASAAAWRSQLAAGALSPASTGVAGGELRSVTTGSSGLWHAFRDAWHGSGLGTGEESGPYLAVLAGATWLVERIPATGASRSAAGLTLALLLFLAPALSAWTAYLAGRVITPSRSGRAFGALVWGSALTVTGGVAEGRLTAALAHVLVPMVLAGFVLAARRDGTYTATFATALVTAVVGAFVPALLALSVLAALALLIVGPGMRRARALVLLVFPAALLGPWVQHFVDDWRSLLSGPGLVTTRGAGSPWVTALGAPDDGVGLWAWMTAPVVVLGIAGYAVRARNRAGAVALGVGGLVALVGLAGALASSRVIVGSAETAVGLSEPARVWAGPFVDLWTLGLLVGLLTGSRLVLRELRRPVRRWAFAGALAAAALAILPVVAGAGRWAVDGIGPTLSVSRAVAPAVAVEQARSPISNRLLFLRPADDVVDFRLVGEEPGELLRGLDDPPGVDDTALVAAVGAVVGGGSAVDSAGLARLGVGFVQVAASADSELARRLDASDGFSRLGASEQGVLWRVRPLAAAPGVAVSTVPSRVRIVDGQDRVLAIVPTIGPHGAVDHVLPAGGARRLLVAEPAEWAAHARVTVDGRVLTPVPETEQPTYAVPPEGGRVRVDLAAAQPWWRLGQGVLLAFVVFMAVPFGNRRSRRQW